MFRTISGFGLQEIVAQTESEAEISRLVSIYGADLASAVEPVAYSRLNIETELLQDVYLESGCGIDGPLDLFRTYCAAGGPGVCAVLVFVFLHCALGADFSRPSGADIQGEISAVNDVE